MKSFFTGLLLAGIVGADDASNGDVTIKGKELFPDFHFNMKLDPENDSNIIFHTYQPNDSYLGIVLGAGGMARGSDMVVFHANGKDSYCSDMTSQGYTKPANDKTKNLSCKHEYKDGEVHFTVKRKLDTGDSNDFVIQTDQKWELGYAFKKGTHEIQKHSKAGHEYITLPSDGKPTFKIGQGKKGNSAVSQALSSAILVASVMVHLAF